MVGNDDLSSSSVSSRSTLCDIDDLSLSPRFLTGHLWYTGSLVVIYGRGRSRSIDNLLLIYRYIEIEYKGRKVDATSQKHDAEGEASCHQKATRRECVGGLQHLLCYIRERRRRI